MLARSDRRGRTHWYSVFGGPENIRGLAEAVGEGSNYVINYQVWSRTVHAADMWRQLSGSGGRPQIRVIRAPMLMRAGYQFAIAMGLDSYLIVMNHYRPDEFAVAQRWVLEEVQPLLGRLEALRIEGE